ncbi:MAG TPA: hypothetical protein P5235_03455 [Saprospiraceae bacterium]|nr:hypothetical protein [Saprospiraceae bacterium]MCB9327432.1 hypothetical protein [Lewinellaceae bacterium]HRX28413.1 hypothetical protein [Saprospiraceae bacterium]
MKQVKNWVIITALLILIVAAEWIYHFSGSIQLLSLLGLSVIICLLLQTKAQKYATLVLIFGFLAASFWFLPLKQFLSFTAIFTITGVFITRSKIPRIFKYGLLLLYLIIIVFLKFQIPLYIYKGIQLSMILLMFRALIYLYDIQFLKSHNPKSFDFFYLGIYTNIPAPFFPVIDYKSLNPSNIFNPDTTDILRGLNIVLRGIVHLIAYRLIYQYFVPGLDDVDDAVSAFHYLVTSYLMIMRMSGLLWLSVGFFYLMGIRLPDIFQNYFLASGFDDFWRRINIYWKNFMLKIFYYPIFFKLKKFGFQKAVVFTTFSLFIISWLLHIYQALIISGHYNFRLTDALFWVVFGLLVCSVQIVPSISKNFLSKNTYLASVRKTLGIVTTFLTITILWSIWMSPNFWDWKILMQLLFSFSLQEFSIFLIGTLILVFVGAYFYLFLGKYDKPRPTTGKVSAFEVTFNSLIVALSILFFMVGERGYFDPKLNTSFSKFVQNPLNANDKDKQFDGYYDQIIDDNANKVLSNANTGKALEQWKKLSDTEILKSTDNILLKELKPNISESFKKFTFSTNEYGFRDKFYSENKPDSTLRFILLGGSIEMGSGVSDDETFESVAESSLNKLDSIPQIEIINMACSSRNIIHDLYVLDNQTDSFHPDGIIMFHHEREWHAICNYFGKLYREGKASQLYPEIKNILDKYPHLENASNWGRKTLLKDQKMEIMAAMYSRIKSIAKARNLKILWIYLPEITNVSASLDTSLLKLVDGNEFYVCDYSQIFDGYTRDSLLTSSFDTHPNREGHAIIAARLKNDLINFVKKYKNNE